MAYEKLQQVKKQRATLRGQRTTGRKHLGREGTIGEHIDQSRMYLNEYWDLTAGVDLLPLPDGMMCEADLIHKVYEECYAAGLNAQNEYGISKGHKERVKSLEQLETAKNTRPMEYIFQCGDMVDHISGEELKQAFQQYLARVQAYCREHGIKCHFIVAALHMDESTPHVHYKVTYAADYERGGCLPKQEECFRQAGLTLPHPDKPESRNNNRLITFTDVCRSIEHEVLQELGHNIETTPRPNMKHKDIRDFYIQSAIDREKQIRASVDRINAQIAAERAEIAQERSKLEHDIQNLTERERAISSRESIVKRLQNDNMICLGGKQYDILDILKGLERYKDADVAQYIDQMQDFFQQVAEQGHDSLQQASDSTEDEDWDDKR